MLVLRTAHCPTRVSIPEGYKALTRLVLGCPSFSSETSKPGQLVAHLQPSALLTRCGCLLVPTRHFSCVSHFASSGRFRKAGLRDETPQDHPPCVWLQGDRAADVGVRVPYWGWGEWARPSGRDGRRRFSGGVRAALEAADRVSAGLLQRVRAEPATGHNFFPGRASRGDFC